jgi:hypothetical protein
MNTSTPSHEHDDDLRPEYRFDYSRAQPNRFAQRPPAGSLTIVLDPDVAQVFGSQEAVNTLLRALIQNMPATVKQAA